MSITYALIYFISGAILFQLLSRLMSVYHGVKLFYRLEKFVSVYALFIDKTTENHTDKYLEALDLPEEEKESLKKSFLTLKTLYRKNVLAIITTSYPKAYKRYARYKTWQELEKYVRSGSFRKVRK